MESAAAQKDAATAIINANLCRITLRPALREGKKFNRKLGIFRCASERGETKPTNSLTFFATFPRNCIRNVKNYQPKQEENRNLHRSEIMCKTFSLNNNNNLVENARDTRRVNAGRNKVVF